MHDLCYSYYSSQSIVSQTSIITFDVSGKPIFYSFFIEIKSLRNYLLIAMMGVLFSYSVYFFLSPEKIIHLGEENSFFELSTAFCFLLSAGLLIYLFIVRKNIFYLLLGILLFFGAGEELSWGQHMFKFKTPEKIKTNNFQGEFNIHNMEIFNTEKFDRCRKSGLERLLEINFLFRVFYIIYCIVIPFAFITFSPVKALAEKIRLPIPPLSVGLFFILNWILYKLTLESIAQNHPLPFYETSTEIFEFNASLLWLLISYYFLLKYRNDRIVMKVS